MSKTGKSRKRKLSGSADEVERMRVVMKAMADTLKAKDDEVKRISRERDVLVEEMVILRKSKRSVAEVLVLQPRQMHVQDLPHCLMLRIFDMLDRTFLTDVVSSVCKQWLLLVCEPSLWARATLVYGNSKGSMMGASAFQRTLASASTLHALECGLSPADPPDVLEMLSTCHTAVEHLYFDLDTAAPEAVMRLMWNSRHCLKELSVREGPLGGSDFSYGQATRFWELIESCGQLRTLVLFLSQKSGLSSCVYSFRPNPQPSLRHLYLDVGVLHEHAKLLQLGIVVRSLITAHRATLERVGLPMLVSMPGVVEALSRCPSLSSVKAPVSEEVHHLSRCEQLRELRLTTDNARRAAGLNLERVLQNICQLRQLRQLHELNISHMGKCSGAHAAVTAGSLAALDELVELRRLRLTCLPTCDALDRLASSPTAAPHLVALYFGESCGDALDAGCRLPALRRLLQGRPHLHVSLNSIKVRDEEPSCCQDHQNLTHTNPVIPVTFVHHEYDLDCAQCAAFNAVGGTTLSLLHGGQFLDGDVDVLWPESPAVSPAKVFPSVVSDVQPLIAESQQDLPVPELDDSVAKEFMGPPHKYRRINSGSSTDAKTTKPSQLKLKATAKTRPPSKRALAVARRTQFTIHKKSAIAARGITILSTEGPPGYAIFQSSGATSANSIKVSPRPSCEGKQLINSPPINVSIPISKIPDGIMPQVTDPTDPSNDCLVQVRLPSGPRASLATAPGTTTSILRSVVVTLPSSTVSSTVSSTISASQKPALGTGLKPASKSPKRQVPKKPPVPRKGKATNDKGVAVPSVPSLPPPAVDTSPQSKPSSLTPSNIPLVSSTLLPGISRLTTGNAGAPPVEVQCGPRDELPPTPARTPPGPPGALEDDAAAAFNASPRRHLNRACRPLSLADSDDALDRIVSSTRKGASRSTPRSRGNKTFLGARPGVKYRKSAPATTTASTEDFSSDAAADDHSDGPFDAPVDSLTDTHAPGDAHTPAPGDAGDNLSDALSAVVRTFASPTTPCFGFTPTCDTVYVEVSTDELKSDAAEDEVAAEYTLEGVVTAGSPVLQELQAAQPDGHCEGVKLEGEEDALNNNSKTCIPPWCGDAMNTDPAWALPVSESSVKICTDSNEQGVV